MGKTKDEKERLRQEKLARRQQEEEIRRNAKRTKEYHKAQEKELARKNKTSSGIKKNCQKKLARYVEKEKHSATDLRIFLDQYLSQYSVDSLLGSCGKQDGENVFLAAVFHGKPDKLKVLIEAIGPTKACLWCKSGRTKIDKSVGGSSILHLAVDVRLANTPAVRLEIVKILLSLLKSDIQELSKVTMTDVDGEVLNARVMANKVKSAQHGEILTIFTSSEEYEGNNPTKLVTFNFRRVPAEAGPAELTTPAEAKNVAGEPASAFKENSQTFRHEKLPAYDEIGSPKHKPANPGANVAQAEQRLSGCSSSSSSSSSGSGSGSQSSSSSDTDDKKPSLGISPVIGQWPASSDAQQGRRRELESEVNQKRRALQDAQERNMALKNEKARLLAEIQALVAANAARNDIGACGEQTPKSVKTCESQGGGSQFGSPNNFFAPVVSTSVPMHPLRNSSTPNGDPVNIANSILDVATRPGMSRQEMLNLCILLLRIVCVYRSHTVREQPTESGSSASTAAASQISPSLSFLIDDLD